MLMPGPSRSPAAGCGSELIAPAAPMRRRARSGSTNPSSRRARLQDFRRVVGEPRALAARQGHMTAVRPALEAVDDIGEPGAALGKVRRVDLGDVAEAYDLGARSGAGH